MKNLLETERLLLRNFQESDLMKLHTLKSIALVWTYSDKTVITDIEETKNISIIFKKTNDLEFEEGERRGIGCMHKYFLVFGCS